MTKREQFTRRGVLAATAVAATTTLGVAGTATASDFQFGDCVVLTCGHPVYRDGCPAENQVAIYETGRNGLVDDTCVDADGVEWVYFQPTTGDITDPNGWLRARGVDHC